MPLQQNESLCVKNLRHNEYYDMQQTFDELYARSLNGETFNNLIELILQRENILLAYRNIKDNAGSSTPGTDNLTIKDIGNLTSDELVAKLRYFVLGTKHGYRPKAVRRKEIPKPNGKTRPLGIPCIWDRLIQQCIKQVLEPICEAKFSENSYGFRPNRSAENAISAIYRNLHHSKCHYIIEFDIKGFFDNVNHSKLMRQIWALGIHDKTLIFVIRRILTAPIRLPNGKTEFPQKGTPQGGILSPLLANIVLNELDKWVESQWQTNPITNKYKGSINRSGSINHGNAYAAMRTTKLKELYLVRYADDFRILCKSMEHAERIKFAVDDWLKTRLHLELSQEKTRIVNVTKTYSEFLGFRIKVQKKNEKWTVKSRISKKQLSTIKSNLTKQVKAIARPKGNSTELKETILYNQMVTGIQNYYQMATHISKDAAILNRAVMTLLTNRMKEQRKTRLFKIGRPLTKYEYARYGKSSMVRYTTCGEPIYPIGYVKHRKPLDKKRTINNYTVEGRALIHKNLGINTYLLHRLMKAITSYESAELKDNKLSLFSAQYGKCAITGIPFTSTDQINCHHIIPRQNGGTDEYSNLVLIEKQWHILIHATTSETIQKYLTLCNPNKAQLIKLNRYRTICGLNEITLN